VPIWPIEQNNNNLDIIEEEDEIPYLNTKTYENTRLISYPTFRLIIPKLDNKWISPRVIL
jgi:hypothetical protein